MFIQIDVEERECDNMSMLVSVSFPVQPCSLLLAMVNNHCLFEMTDEIVPVAFYLVGGCVLIVLNCTGDGQNNKDTLHFNAKDYNKSKTQYK